LPDARRLSIASRSSDAEIRALVGGSYPHDTTTGYWLQAGTRDCTIVVRRGDTVVDETSGAHTIIRRGR